MSDNSKALAIVPQTLVEVREMSVQFAKSNLLPDGLRGKEADVFVTLLAGQELGMPPMAALRGIHVVKGKTVLSADSMVGVVLGRGVAVYFRRIEETATSVTYETLRRDDTVPQRMTWTDEDTKRAGLDGDNWRKYKPAMRRARCKAALARDVYPDVLAGCYDDDEGREMGGPAVTPAPHRAAGPAASTADDAIDAEIVSETKAEPASGPATSRPEPMRPPMIDLDAIADLLCEDIDACGTLAEIEALAPKFGALPKGTPQRARAHAKYAAQKKAIAEAILQATIDGGGP